MKKFLWCIDAGNSSIKWGVFSDNQLIEVFQFRQDPTKEEWQAIAITYPPHRIASSSVRGDLPWLKDSNVEWLSVASVQFFEWDYQPAESMGLDRIAAVIGARALLPTSSALLVIDVGTCITYTLLKKGVISGLAISPGLQMRWNAMHHFTAQLPMVNHETVINNNGTLKNLQVGGMTGWNKELEGMIDLFCEAHQLEHVVLTGSDVVHLENHFKERFVIIDHLNLWGLNYWLNEG